MMGIAEGILLTIVTAATPLLIAAIGELVVERSGVLNLGVEGMMIMGAVGGFGAALLTGSPWIGLLAGDRRAARCSRCCLRFLTLTLVTNQVATGLALTHSRPRPFGHDRRRASSACRASGCPISTFRACPTSRSSAGCCSARIRSSTSRSR